MDRKIVGFRLKEEEFAFDIMHVIEIIKIKDITEVPTAPDFIEGVINLRGKIIPIIDLRKRFRIGAAEKREKGNRIIISEFGSGQFVGSVVDMVEKVITVSDEELMPAPPNITGVGAKYIDGIIHKEDRIIVLLNIDRVFSEDEQAVIAEAANLRGEMIEESPDS